jgi:hypothetical protein
VSTRHDDFATKITDQAASVAELGLEDRDILCFEKRLDANETYARRRLLRSPLPARTDRPVTHLFAQARLWRRRPGRDRLRLLPLDVGGDDELSQVRPLLDVLPTLVPQTDFCPTLSFEEEGDAELLLVGAAIRDMQRLRLTRRQSLRTSLRGLLDCPSIRGLRR